MSSSGCTLDAGWVLKMNYVRSLGGRFQNRFTKNLALVLTFTPKTFFRNHQANPLGIVGSTWFVTAVLLTVQPKVSNRVLLLAPILEK